MNVRYQVPENLDRKASYVWLSSWGLRIFVSRSGYLGQSWRAFDRNDYCRPVQRSGFIARCFYRRRTWFQAAEKFDHAMETHDSKMIVVDEVVGQWIAMIPALGSLPLLLLSFVLFRVFDILKPWPVSHFEKCAGSRRGNG